MDRFCLGQFCLPVLALLLASWLSWQDLAKFLLHLGNHGSHGKILIKILLRYYTFPSSYLITMNKTLKLIKKYIPSVQAAEIQSKGPFHPTMTISTRFHDQNAY